jgi:hypothetical protein
MNLSRRESPVNVRVYTCQGSAPGKQIADEIPMPRVAADAAAWILERFVLETGSWETYSAAVIDQALAIGGDEVGHGAPLPHVAVEP